MAFRRQALLPALVVLLAGLSAPVCYSQVSQGTQSGVVDLSGNAVDPLPASKGKVVVLIFVRSDCPISNRYAPTIQRLSEVHAGKTVFWLVYPSRKETAEMIREHDQQFGYKIPAVRDPQHALVKLSQAQITPEAAVFERNGHLAYHGRIDNLYQDFGHRREAPTTHELDDAIHAAVNGQTLSATGTAAVGCYISDLE